MPQAFLVVCILFFLILNIGVILWAASILGSWRAPYVPLPHASLPGICEALRIDAASVVYDIGSGDGRVLRACAAHEPKAQYIGIERAWYPYLLARLHGTAHGHIRYVCADARLRTYADANRVVLYLLPDLTKEIGEKVLRDATPGTRIVSVDFPIASCTPEAVIEQIKLPHHVRGRMLYIYEKN